MNFDPFTAATDRLLGERIMTAYDIGYEAFDNGEDPDRNPYWYASEEYYEWMRGFLDASRGRDKEIV